MQESDLQRASKILRTEFGSDWKQIVQTLGTRELMKNQLLENGELYERFGINPQIFSLLMTTSVDQEGKLQIQWGEQKIS